MRTEQKHTRNNYLNDGLTAFALPVDKYGVGVCSLICSEFRKLRYVEDIVKEVPVRAYQAKHSGATARILRLGLHYDPQPLQNYDRPKSRHHYSEFAEAYTPRGWQGHLLLHKAIAKGVQENESEANRMIIGDFCILGEMEAKV